MLIYSDGAFELTLADGTLWSLPDFIEMCRGMAGTPQWSLDALISRLKAVATSGSFEDDCTLVQLSLP
jgi:sigma-B regulation protein RsbU (phosphoserine phosphatase)